MRIRPAVIDDVDAIVSLERACFADAWSADSVREELTGPGRIVQVAQAPGEPIAGYVCIQVVADVADLLRIAVDSSARRIGVGTQLLEAALGGAVAAGASRMLLEVAEDNRPARSLYDAHAFDEIHRRRGYYTGGGDAVVLERALI